MKVTFWQRLEDYPPPLVRLLARRREAGTPINIPSRAVTDEELAITLGIPLVELKELYYQPNWDAIPIGRARDFLHACGVDPTVWTDRNRVRTYMSGNSKYAYLRKSPEWESTFKPLICHLKAVVRRKAK